MTTRRTFIKQTAIAGAGLMMNPSELFKYNKEIGIQLYTVRSEVFKDLENSIANIAKAGYTEVELFGYNNRKFFGKTVAEMAALLKKYNLKSPSGHYGLNDFLHGENYNYDSWKYLIEDAKTLGHTHLVIPYLDDKHRTADDYKRVAERLNKGGEMARKAKMCAGYHNHEFEFNNLNGTTGWEILLNNTEKKNVEFEMDIYWVKYANQEPETWFKRYPGRFTMWHVKDLDPQPEKHTTIVGKGIIDFKKIYQQRKLSGLKYLYVEQEQYDKPVFECIKESYDYIKKNIVV